MQELVRHPFRVLGELPSQHKPGVYGIIIFGISGFGDMIWHETLGVESNTDILLSPPTSVCSSASSCRRPRFGRLGLMRKAERPDGNLNSFSYLEQGRLGAWFNSFSATPTCGSEVCRSSATAVPLISAISIPTTKALRLGCRVSGFRRYFFLGYSSCF